MIAEAVIFSVSFGVLAFSSFLLFKLADRRLSVALGALFAAYVALDDLATSLPSISPFFSLVEGGDWNWSGKIYSLLLSALVLFALGIKAEAAGLTWRQRNIKASWISLLLFILWGVSLGLLFKPSAPSAETLAFQALMPGLAEEIAYRGIAPALLLGWIRGKDAARGIPWTVVFITALVFAVWHGLGYADGGFSFDPLAALFPFVGGIAAGWLRFSSGSLLFPILVHGVANVAFHLAPHLGG